MNDWIEILGLRLECIVGVLEREQHTPQPLEIGLRLALSLEVSGEQADLGRGVDYAAVTEQVEMLARHGRFRLLESLGLAICRLLLAPPAPGERRAQVDRVEVTLRKPEVLDGLAIPGIRMVRQAGWAELRAQDLADGVQAEVLIETPTTGAWRVKVDPEACWRPAPGVASMLLVGAATRGAEVLKPGARLARALGEPVTAGAEGCTWLAVGAPPLR